MFKQKTQMELKFQQLILHRSFLHNQKQKPAKTVNVQGATQTGKPEFQGGTAMVNGEEKTVEMDDTVPAKLVDPKTGDKVDSLTVEGEGTYTVAPDGTVTFKPEPKIHRCS